MISTALALAMSLQGATETAVAIKNDEPETWTVEYPRIIRPFVVQYRNCLGSSNRIVRGVADFEMQHRSDIPRCADIAAQAITRSNAAMIGAKTKLTPEEVDRLFGNIGMIHIARGRDLDNQFTQRLQRAEARQVEYRENQGDGLLLNRPVQEPVQESEPLDAQN
ncbi:hypothetical protein [Erythrobacter sp. JK5]|uniref:hypothetical protein n=1 Tax=Erythrobacter sp. JK5 TaxID=2829500 RepID=UPI001BA5E7C4|nr:hypothetical protein [Erythrobacter sp. JK5]QUL37233.1 hypothetical protein KDC96_12740 [Erythrobacter sp. JK5]